MAIETKYPVSLEERLELGPDTISLPGSFEEYQELLNVCAFPIEYEDDNIIFMSIASDPHERIVANLLGILYLLFKDAPAFKRYGSNRHVYIPEFVSDYSPDVSMVLGEPELYELRKGLSANLNPWMIAEVLSESTRNRDFGKKLFRYKRIPSLRYILFIEQDLPLITVYRFDETAKRWVSTDYNLLDESFSLDERPISLNDIYLDVLTP